MSAKKKVRRPRLPPELKRTGMQIYFPPAVHEAITRCTSQDGVRYRTTWVEQAVEKALAERGELTLPGFR